MRPLSQVSAEAQEDIGQQGRPDLPFYGALAVAQKVGQLEGLFELLEKDFDAPAAMFGRGVHDGAAGKESMGSPIGWFIFHLDITSERSRMVPIPRQLRIEYPAPCTILLRKSRGATSLMSRGDRRASPFFSRMLIVGISVGSENG